MQINKDCAAARIVATTNSDIQNEVSLKPTVCSDCLNFIYLSDTIW